MSNKEILERLLVDWEDAREDGPSLTLDRFVQSQCVGVDDRIIREFRRKVAALDSIDQRMASNDPTSELHNTRTSSKQQLAPGSKPVQGYELIERIGGGGFGEVWKARSPGGFHVALKFVRAEGRLGAIELKSLEVIRNIRHSHLLSVFGTWRYGDFLVIAMELADQTLHDRYKEAKKNGNKGIPRRELLGYFAEIAKGIDWLNAPNPDDRLPIQHRDIKPQNLFLLGGSAKVGDFGLAREMAFDLVEHTGSMTLAYAAPECLAGTTSNRSDQYSLAVTYCQLRSGKLPFDGSPIQVIEGHRRKSPDLSMLSAEERHIVAKSLSKLPKDRWKSCSEFVQQLATVERRIGPRRSRATLIGGGRWHLMSFALLAAISLLVVSFSAMSFSNFNPSVSSSVPSPASSSIVPGHVETREPAKAIKNDPELTQPPPVVKEVESSPLPSGGSDFSNSLGIKFRMIPAGEFLMGSSPEQIDAVMKIDPNFQRSSGRTEEPQHLVRITKPFYLGIYEVTKGEFASFAEETGYRAKSSLGALWKDPGFEQTDSHPVVNVSWNDATAFCRWLSKKEGMHYRLPTEAEWEYACRAGTSTMFSIGNDPEMVSLVGNIPDADAAKSFPSFESISSHDGFVFTSPVGSFSANPFGLHDMHGNVLEWCSDSFGDDYYLQSPTNDPQGPPKGTYKVCRGGCWNGAPRGSRSAFRHRRNASDRKNYLGFRLAISASEN